MTLNEMKLRDRIESYAREWIDEEWKFYKPFRTIPVRSTYAATIQNWQKGRVNKDGTGKEYTNYLRFPQEWYEQDHWAYGCKNGEWYVYRVYMRDGQEFERKIVTSTGSTRMHKDAVLGQILDGTWKVNDADKKESCTKTIHYSDYAVKFSELFDGKSIIALMAWKPKMTYQEIMMVIENEHGSVDAQGIVHKAE